MTYTYTCKLRRAATGHDAWCMADKVNELGLGPEINPWVAAAWPIGDTMAVRSDNLAGLNLFEQWMQRQGYDTRSGTAVNWEATTEAKPHCGRCEFFQPTTTDNAHGQCRRNAPQVTTPAWPVVLNGERCGEFKNK